MAILKTEELTYVYSQGTPFEKTAVDHVNLEIEKGEFVGVIGHTGSGKSTMIQHFNGLLKPTSGKIYLDGEDIWADKTKIRQVRFKVGLVFQYPEYQIFEDTVYKDIAFGPKNMKLSENEIDGRVRRTALSVGLTEDILEKSPFELSGGQKRRVAIAGVMAMEPEVLILDEPTAGLDPQGRDMILNQINNYHKTTGCTVLLVSHSMEDVAKFASKILVMNDSKVFCYDKTAEVFKRSEEISSMGLSVPQIARVFNILKNKGISFDEEVYTVKYAKELEKKGENLMIKDITLGQYFPGNSIVHRLDPRYKIIISGIFIAMLFIGDHVICLEIGAVFVAMALILSSIPVKMIVKSIKPIIPLLLFTCCCSYNVFYVCKNNSSDCRNFASDLHYFSYCAYRCN